MKIEISTEQLNADISKMKEEKEALVQARNNVFTCLEKINAMWEGQAHDIFVLQVVRDTAVMNDLLSNIDNLIDCMSYAKTEYDKCTQDVKQKIAALRLSSDT